MLIVFWCSFRVLYFLCFEWFEWNPLKQLLVGGLLRAGSVFLSWDEWKKLQHFETHLFLDLVLENCYEIIEAMGIYLLFHSIVLARVVVLFVRDRFFHLFVSFLCEVSVALQFYGNVWKWTSELIRSLAGWLWCFGWKKPRFFDNISVWAETSKNFSNNIPFWRPQIFSIVGLWAILVWFLNVPVLLSDRILQYHLKSLSNPMLLHFHCFWVFLSKSPESSD